MAAEHGEISTVDYEPSNDAYVYGVRRGDGSEWAAADVVLKAVTPSSCEGGSGGRA